MNDAVLVFLSLIWTYFTPFSSAPITDAEQVNVSWVVFILLFQKQLVKTPRTEIDDDAFDPRYSSFPGTSVFDEDIKMESQGDYSASTLPKSFLSKTKKVFMYKQPTVSVSTGALGSISEDKPTETTKPSYQHKRGRKINLHGLYDGVKQLRYLLDIGDLGVTPDETVVAAMLDLVSIINPFVPSAPFLYPPENIFKKIL